MFTSKQLEEILQHNDSESMLYNLAQALLLERTHNTLHEEACHALRMLGLLTLDQGVQISLREEPIIGASQLFQCIYKERQRYIENINELNQQLKLLKMKSYV